MESFIDIRHTNGTLVQYGCMETVMENNFAEVAVSQHSNNMVTEAKWALILVCCHLFWQFRLESQMYTLY